MFLVIIAVLLSGCATTLETVAVPTDSSGWKFGAGSDRRGNTLVEFVPSGESINQWSKLFTIQFLEGEKRSPETLMGQLKSMMQTRCPNTSWEVIVQDDQSILYEWKIISCQGNPDQHEIARLLKGNDGVHRIAYVEKAKSIDTATREKWIKAFTNAYVEKGGKRVVLAP